MTPASSGIGATAKAPTTGRRPSVAQPSRSGKASATRIARPFQYSTGYDRRSSMPGKIVARSSLTKSGYNRLASASAATATSPIAIPSRQRGALSRVPAATASTKMPR